MTVMIAIAKPFVGTEEKEAVCKVIDSGMIACGAVVEQFEKEFAAYALVISVTGISKIVVFARNGVSEHPFMKWLLSVLIVKK